MYRVVKRDGKIKDFNIEKIVDAITLAFAAKGKEFNKSITDFLALKGDLHTTYFTKAIFNYNNEMPRILKLHVIVNEESIATMTF